MWFFPLVLLIINVNVYKLVLGHGRLMDPPARNSMWREGYPNPVNYDDNQLYCGGAGVQWGENEGKCGVCGDAWNQNPRPHEVGGIYARGIVTRRYSVGQVIKISVDLTTNHMGHFELNICPVMNPAKEVTEECLQQHPVKLVEEDSYQFMITEDIPKSGEVSYQVRLPPQLTCNQCVLRWKYVTGNTWSVCPNGTEANGCGPQENFINCADIAIHSNAAGSIPPPFIDNPHVYYIVDVKQPGYVLKPLVVHTDACIATSNHIAVPGMNEYCRNHCLRYPSICPEDRCKCLTRCWSIGEIAGQEGSDEYCMDKCLVSSSATSCPLHRCQCE